MFINIYNPLTRCNILCRIIIVVSVYLLWSLDNASRVFQKPSFYFYLYEIVVKFTYIIISQDSTSVISLLLNNG